MAYRKIIGALLALVLVSCAQVGTISGGDEDVFAPRPIPEKTLPSNGSTNFSGNQFEITFDEFVQLNNPLQTLVIVPDHAKLKATLQKKTLKVSWDEPLKENTTYVVYMNGTIKDVTENNDSLMTYVFSTGSTIDSLSYSVRVVDAYTNQFLPDITVGLFLENDLTRPYYFGQTTEWGEAKFQYLQKGTYFLRAFKDENKDLKLQESETAAFRSEKVVIDSSSIDTIPLRLFNPAEKKKLISFAPASPGALTVEASVPFTNSTFQLNSATIDTSLMIPLSPSKMMMFTDLSSLSEIELVVSGPDLTDTLSLRLTDKEKKGKINLSPMYKNGTVGPHEQLVFSINDLIRSADTNLMTLKDALDTTKIIPFKTRIFKNQLIIDFDRTSSKQLELVIKKGAVETIHSQFSEELKTNVKVNTEKDYGVIQINAGNFQGPVIVELLLDSKTIDHLVLYDSKKGSFNNVFPDEYQLRVISDENKNGKWDTGDINMAIQPEAIHWFTKPTKVRANWEIEVILSPTN